MCRHLRIRSGGTTSIQTSRRLRIASDSSVKPAGPSIGGKRVSRRIAEQSAMMILSVISFRVESNSYDSLSPACRSARSAIGRIIQSSLLFLENPTQITSEVAVWTYYVSTFHNQAHTMNNLSTALKPLMLGLLLALPGSAIADEDVEYYCEDSAQNISSIIEDWYLFVKEYGAEEKNPSVLAMHADHEKGLLAKKIKNQCVGGWAKHEDLFTCFAGTRSEMGAASCMHPETDKNGWLYK